MSRDARWLLWVPVILALTLLTPPDFQAHPHWDRVEWVPFSGPYLSVRDMVGNVLLFLPLGYLYARSRRSRPGRGAAAVSLRAAGLAAALSVSVELAQVFSHNHFATATDVTMNVLGAALGAQLALASRRPPRDGGVSPEPGAEGSSSASRSRGSSSNHSSPVSSSSGKSR